MNACISAVPPLNAAECPRCRASERLRNGHCAPCEAARKAYTKTKPCIRCGAVERGPGGHCRACKRTYARAVNSTPEGRVKKAASRDNSPEARAARALKRGTAVELWRRRRRRTAEHVRERERAYAKRADALRPGRGTHVDHDHATGRVRGLLCSDCNLAEGFVRSSASRARMLAAYLDRFSDLNGGNRA